mgnify:CR=1 FL=1
MSPLQGLTVLDLTRVLSGPYCTMMLGDLGARVIKVEHPRGGDDTRAWGPPFVEGESSYFLSVNRNKESVTLDFKHPEGRALLEQLIARADVLIENFRPGTLEKLGLDYASLAPRFPRLVYCSISGFGHTGPRAAEPGYDAVIQAEGGLMSLTGATGQTPYRVGVAIADIVSGLFAAQGITSALFARERTGRGQHVDIAMLDSLAALMTYQAGICFATGQAPPRLGNRHPTIVPYETFQASDGDFIIAVGNDDLWRRFCNATGFPGDDRYATNRARVEHYAALKPALDAHLRTATRAHWLQALQAAGIPCGSVRDLQELFADPQLQARDMLPTVVHPRTGPLSQVGSPLKLSETPTAVRTAPPCLGADTVRVLTDDLGLTAAQVDHLRVDGVI